MKNVWITNLGSVIAGIIVSLIFWAFDPFGTIQIRFLFALIVAFLVIIWIIAIKLFSQKSMIQSFLVNECNTSRIMKRTTLYSLYSLKDRFNPGKTRYSNIRKISAMFLAGTSIFAPHDVTPVLRNTLDKEINKVLLAGKSVNVILLTPNSFAARDAESKMDNRLIPSNEVIIRNYGCIQRLLNDKKNAFSKAYSDGRFQYRFTDVAILDRLH